MGGGGTAFPWHDPFLTPPNPQHADDRPGGTPAVGTAEPSATTPHRPQTPLPGQGTAPHPTPPPPTPSRDDRRRGARQRRDYRGRAPRQAPLCVNQPRSPWLSSPCFPRNLRKPRHAHQQAVNGAPPRGCGAPGLPAWPASRLPERQDAPMHPPLEEPGRKHRETNRSSMETAPSMA